MLSSVSMTSAFRTEFLASLRALYIISHSTSGRTVEEMCAVFQSARILAKLAAWSKARMALREQKYYMGWLIVSLNNEVGNKLTSMFNFLTVEPKFTRPAYRTDAAAIDWYLLRARARPQQQTRRPLLLLSIDGTDRRTDGHSTVL